MRGLLQRMNGTDAEAVAALRVVSTFDDLLTAQAPLAEMVGVAAAMVGAPVHVQDDWNGRRLAAPDPSATSETPRAVPAHGAEPVTDRTGERLVAPVAVAEGRIGAVWTDVATDLVTPLMRLALERLAAAVAIDAARVRAGEGGDGRRDALARLAGLGGRPPDADEVPALARSCGLDPTVPYLLVAVRAGEPLAGHVLAAAVARASGVPPAWAGGSGRTGVLVVRREDEARLADAAIAAAPEAWRLRLGVAPPSTCDAFPAAGTSARDALAFADDATPLVAAADLGVLALLAELPAEAVAASPDVKAVARLAAGPAGAEDLVLLRHYCETGSLRETAVLVHRHHSSVDYRVKRIAATLGFGLDRPAGRMRALLALRVWLLQRARNTR